MTTKPMTTKPMTTKPMTTKPMTTKPMDCFITKDLLYPREHPEYDSVFKRYSEEKFKIFESLPGHENFKNIGEIGVGTGVAALMFLRQAPKAKYHGFDNLSYPAGTPGPEGEKAIEYTKKLLKDYSPEICICDTQTLKELPMEATTKFDFFHVDGCHTDAGVVHDLNLVLPRMAPGGFILVDDTIYFPGVGQSTKKWLNEKEGFLYKEFQTLRGDILIRVP